MNREKFESRLQEHLEAKYTRKSDVAWYALRNTVYAYGCKLVRSKSSDPNAYEETQAKARGYFSNALSVHTRLIYSSPSLASVQALLLMVGYSPFACLQVRFMLICLVVQAFFVDNTVCHSLIYMLVSNAVRSAQVLGLHLEAPKFPMLENSAIQERRRVFWSAYIFDKQIAFRCGRPSASVALNAPSQMC